MNIAVIARLDISNIRDAYKLFETFNNRGLRLSATDLIKNLLLGQASKINEGEYLVAVKTMWSEIIVELDKLDNDNPDVFFRRYFSSVLRDSISQNKLIDIFKKYYIANVIDNEGNALLFGENEHEEDETPDEEYAQEAENGENQNGRMSIVQLLENILNAARTYRKISLATFEDRIINDEIKRLNDIKCETTYTFLMQFMQTDVDSNIKKEVIKMVATLMLRRHICGRRTGENNRIFASLVRCLDHIAEMNEFLHQLFINLTQEAYYPNDNEFNTRLQTYGFNGYFPRARVLLGTFNAHVNNGVAQHEAANALIHQIIPERLDGDWLNYLGDRANVQIERIANTLGNLTLMSTDVYVIVNNAENPFLRKRPTYANSNFSMTRELGQMPNFRFDEVEERNKRIAEVVMEYWKIQDLDEGGFIPPPAGGGNVPPVQPAEPVTPITPMGGGNLTNPSLLLVPGNSKNIQVSIQKSVSREFAINYLPDKFVEDLIEQAGGIYCFAFPHTRQGVWNRLDKGDIVLITERNTGEFRHFGKVTAKYESADFGNHLWPVRGGSTWKYIYFLKDMRRIKINKWELTRDLHFAPEFRLPGQILIKCNDKRLIDLKANNKYGQLFTW